nr:VWA domain-containing protein [Parahaliea mediterranea]
MGPSWRQQASPLQQDQSALVVLLDVSESMSQRDVQPSRLARAKQKVSDLLALSPDRKAALIVYAGSAHTVLSLTGDRDILHQYLDAVAPAIMPRSGKFPEYALPRVDAVLREHGGPASLVLLADGAGADSAAAFGDYFDSRAHQLLVLGVGGDIVTEDEIPLDRPALRELAAAAGGDYLDLTVDDDDVRAIDRKIGSYYVPVDDAALPWLDGGYPLVFPALALLLLWFRRGWTLTWGLLPALLWLGAAGAPAPALADGATEPATATKSAESPASHWFADLWLTPDQQGRLLMQRGDYREAARRFRDPMWKALALYYAEDFMQAAAWYSRSDSDAALFNEANARAHARDYLRALLRYDRLLARSPDFPGARANRARVQALVDEINRLSESQQAEPGEDSTELGEDDPRAAEGADEQVWRKAEVEQLTAEQVLGSEATRDMWLRGVQRDPAAFLATKFSMQLEQGPEPGEPNAAKASP